MKNDSHQDNLHSEASTAVPKNVWVKPEVEMISILAGTRQGGREGLYSYGGLRAYYS